MMSDRDIQSAIEAGEVAIVPFRGSQLQPASYDVTLGSQFIPNPLPRPISGAVDQKKVYMKEIVLKPGGFMLGHTMERLTLSRHVVARVEGKSSWGRRGLMVHITAGFIDPGFSGQLTLEFHNVSNHDITLKVGDKIGQLSFFRLDTPADRVYGQPGLGSHYQSQVGAVGPRG